MSSYYFCNVTALTKLQKRLVTDTATTLLEGHGGPRTFESARIIKFWRRLFFGRNCFGMNSHVRIDISVEILFRAHIFKTLIASQCLFPYTYTTNSHRKEG